MKKTDIKRSLRTILVRLGLVSLMLAGLLAAAPMGTARAASTWTVTKTADTSDGTCDSDCSLREAIAAASSGDTIVFTSTLSGGTITLSSTLAPATNVTIDGSALASPVTISGGTTVRVFSIGSGVSVALNGLKINNGTVTGAGGAISNAGTLSVTNSTFFNNRASTNGGAIYNTGTLTVTGSTFLTNTATSGSGGAIYNTGSLTLTNDTFNQSRAASGSGGAVYNSGSTLVLNNNTFYGGRAASGSGGGIYNAAAAGTLTIHNTIVTGSLAGGNCAGSMSAFSGANNLANDATCGSSFTNSASINLGTFGSNGGSTQTIPLLSSSVALNAGSGCEATDQRGVSRPQGSACDIGAYEQQLPTAVTGSASTIGYDTATLAGTVNANNASTTVFFQYGETDSYGTSVAASPSTVTGGSDTSVSVVLSDLTPGTTYHYRVTGQNLAGTAYGSDATFTTVYCEAAVTVTNTNDSGSGSLRQAIADICPGGTITFDADYTITPSSELSIGKNMIIDGSGHTITVSGGGSHRVFHVGNVTATLKNLTIANGKLTGGGGGIYLYYGTLNLSNVTLSGNSAADPMYSGGAIYNYYGTLNISNSIFSGNTATNNGGGTGAAGAIFNDSGTVNIVSSTFSGNTASNASGSSAGGAIYNFGTLTVSASTFSGNNATASSGSIAGGIVNASSAILATIQNTILSNNQSGSNCAGSFTDGGYNLEWGAGAASATCGFGTTSADPLLSVLGDYGGSTRTFALLPGSAAIDSGSGCASTDQRGESRVGACDVGAFESQGFTLATSDGDEQSTPIGTAFADPLEVTVTADNSVEPVDGGLVTFTPPASGASAALATSPAAISGGLASVSAVANGNVGSYLFDADTAGASEPVAFSLTNTDISAPTVTTGAATDITSSSATLNGTVNANGASTDVTFEYGADTSYGATVTATGSPVSGVTDTAVSYALSGLTPNTTYHFRAVGENAAGATDGADASFTTPCLSAVTVTNANDSGAGSLRQAIADVCAGGTIDFAADYTIHLSSQLSISQNLTITGSGHSITISGDSDSNGSCDVRVFYIDPASGTVTLDHLTITRGYDSNGGGIYNTGSLAVTNSTFSGNISSNGGGIYNTGWLTVRYSTFSGNQSLGLGTYSGGGGIYNYSGILTVTNSTFSGNRARRFGGGIYGMPGISLTINNSTFSGNSSDYGGGIYTSGSLTVTNSTFSGNTSTPGSGGSGIYKNPGGVLILTNSILVSNTAPNCYGISSSESNNLVNDSSCGSSATASSAIRLGTLGNYGGDTQTIPLLPGSAAINAGNSSNCLTTDQRGLSRVGTCDIGAFESQGFTLAISGGDGQSTPINTEFPLPLAVTVTASNPVEPVDGGVVTFTHPASGASAALATSPAAISGGAVSVTATANATGGTYNVTASTTGATNVGFSLTNTTNSAPTVANPIANVTVDEDAADTPLDLSSVFADVDIADGDSLTLSVEGNTNPALLPPTLTGTTLTLDYLADQNGTATITVRATDTEGAYVEDSFLVTVNAVDDAPTALALSNAGLQENLAAGTLVGSLSTTDIDTGDTFSYSLVNGGTSCPGTDNASFQVPSGTDRLENASALDYETKASYAICVRTTDSGGLTFNQPFTITVTDVDDTLPGVTSILRQNPVASLTNAVSVTFRVTFSEDVQNGGPTDFVLTTTGTATGTIDAVVIQSASVYDVAVTGVGGNGTLGLTFAATNDIADLSGNLLGASPAIGTYETYVIDNTPIEIALTGGVVGNPGTLEIVDLGVYQSHFTQIVVTFTADAYNPAGNTDTDDVTNPENYLLLQPGPDGEYDTPGCSAYALDGPYDDDIQVPTGPVTYSNTDGYVSTVTVNGGMPLPSGNYRLYICGSTSITDLVGNELNNGLDTVLDFTITDPVTAVSIPSTGFAPDRVTALPEQTVAYTRSDLWLEIPKLGVKMDIVGVPQVDGEWDVSWLGNNAGWLNGSAYPTWNGNSVLTGHVVDANGKAGPFRYLNTLWYGDQVIIHAGGAQYVYEVRSVTQVGPGSTAQLLKHEDLPWVTLVTCRGYDETTGTYRYRVLVRAVLVAVK